MQVKQNAASPVMQDFRQESYLCASAVYMLLFCPILRLTMRLLRCLTGDGLVSLEDGCLLPDGRTFNARPTDLLFISFGTTNNTPVLVSSCCPRNFTTNARLQN
jgi:hypothetical protein